MRKSGLIGVISVSALLGLAACGGGEETAPAAEAPAETAAAPPPAATPPAATPAPAAGAPAAGGATVTLAGLTGDPVAGERVFAQCRTCHSVVAGENKVGPSLAGIIGRESGTIPGFRYSQANLDSNVTWTPEVMFEYLENPREFMPGTYMSFVGLRQPQQRADVIAYLQSQS